MSFSCMKGESDQCFDRLDQPVGESWPGRFPSLIRRAGWKWPLFKPNHHCRMRLLFNCRNTLLRTCQMTCRGTWGKGWLWHSSLTWWFFLCRRKRSPARPLPVETDGMRLLAAHTSTARQQGLVGARMCWKHCLLDAWYCLSHCRKRKPKSTSYENKSKSERFRVGWGGFWLINTAERSDTAVKK